MDVLAQVRATIDTHALLVPGSMVVVGVSGGPDSLCLLHVLCRLRGDYGVGLHVAHLNHGLRAEAAADAAFVAALADRWGLPHTLGATDVRALAEAERKTIEEAARIARYRFLVEVACGRGARTVAVGHNADDQVETVLMHCLRGAGLAGLGGMRYRADWPQPVAEDCVAPLLIRPLLDIPRADIERYCQEHDLQPRLDYTNLQITYFRNRIRRQLIPTLETFNPRIRELLRHTASVVADDYDYLEHDLDVLWPELTLLQTDSHVVFGRDAFRRLSRSPQRRALRRAIRSLRRSLRDVAWIHTEEALRAAEEAPTGTIVTLPAGLVFEVSYDRLILRSSAQPLPNYREPTMASPELDLQLPGTTVLAPGGWQLRAWLTDEPQPAARSEGPRRLQLCLDAERVGSRLHLRTRHSGDRFQPLGMGGHHKSVKDFMIDAKIPRAERARIPLLVSDRGILWIVGWVPSELAAPGPATRHYLCLELVPPTPADSRGELLP